MCLLPASLLTLGERYLDHIISFLFSSFPSLLFFLTLWYHASTCFFAVTITREVTPGYCNNDLYYISFSPSPLVAHLSHLIPLLFSFLLFAIHYLQRKRQTISECDTTATSPLFVSPSFSAFLICEAHL